MPDRKGSPQLPVGPSERRASERLDSWKEIAAYLRRDDTTVQRWEKREGLPVHRHIHEKLGTVYAYKPELDVWWNNRRPRLEQQPKTPADRGRRLLWWAAGAAVLSLAAVVAVWQYRAHLAATARAEIVTRRVWTGPDADRLGSPSPDGRYCSYTDPATGDLAIRYLTTGQQRHLTNSRPRSRWECAESPVVSLDGKQIAYSWFNQDLFYDLRVIGADGSGQRVLYRNREVFCARPADWSPDRKHILARLSLKDQTNQIGLVEVANGSVRVLKSLGWRYPLKMNFSPDGRYIVYDLPPREDSQERDIVLLGVTPEAGEGREIPLFEHRGNDFVLGWAPDGRTILFARDRTGTLDAWAIQVAGGKPQGEPELVKKDIGRI